MSVTSRTGIISIISVKSGDKFIYMIKVAFTVIKFKFKINEFLSDPLTFMQGVCQGCTLLMLLYIILVKVLANFIHKD